MRHSLGYLLSLIHLSSILECPLASSAFALQLRVSFVPSGSPLVGMSHLKQPALLEGRGRNLHADGQT